MRRCIPIKTITTLLILSCMICTSILVQPTPLSMLQDPADNQSSGSASLLVGPYPLFTQHDNVMIIWQTTTPTTQNIVNYGLDPSCEHSDYDNDTREFHHHHLGDLEAGKTYYYRIESEDMRSQTYHFTTPPIRSDKVEFIAYGDTRGVWDGWRNASVVATAIESEETDFIIHTGDFVKNGVNEEEWVEYFTASTFMHNATLYPILGNHEYYADLFSCYFPTPTDKYWYSFDYGPVHCIGLDSNSKSVFRVRQLFWLCRDLAQNDKPFTVVFFHHPPYSAGNHGSVHHLRWIWSPIFGVFDVDLVINGHDHNYERAEVDEVTYLVTGGGGAPLYSNGTEWWTIYSESAYHYCAISIEDHILSCEVKTPSGEIIDSFTIEKTINTYR